MNATNLSCEIIFISKDISRSERITFFNSDINSIALNYK